MSSTRRLQPCEDMHPNMENHGPLEMGIVRCLQIVGSRCHVVWSRQRCIKSRLLSQPCEWFLPSQVSSCFLTESWQLRCYRYELIEGVFPAKTQAKTPSNLNQIDLARDLSRPGPAMINPARPLEPARPTAEHCSSVLWLFIRISGEHSTEHEPTLW